MSLHFLLDGYNILKQDPAFRDLPLEEGRKGFLRWIVHSRPQGSVNNQVTVVFDGHPDHMGAALPSHAEDSYKSQEAVRVIFSQGCSADDTIKRMVEEDAEKKSCVVVSDDKGVYLYARSMGARVMSVGAFTTKARGIGARADPGGKYIPLTQQEKINKELRPFWLKEKP